MAKAMRRWTMCLVVAFALAMTCGVAAYAQPLEAGQTACAHSSLSTQAIKVSKVSAAKVKQAKILTFLDSPYSQGFIDGRYNGKYSFGSFQNFAYTPDKKHVFAVNIARNYLYTGDQRSTGLICYSLKGKKATFTDGAVLKYYGHSDVLAISQPDKAKERYHVWVAKGNGKNPKTKDDEYGRVIQRLTISINKKGRMSIDQAVSLKAFGYARAVQNGSARSFARFEYGNPIRVTAAVNQDANRAAFRLRFVEGAGVNYVVYDLEKLNAKLDAALGGKKTATFLMGNAADVQLSNTRFSDVPGGGFQSMDVDERCLYVCGWDGEGKSSYNAGIYRVPYRNLIDEDYAHTEAGVEQCVMMQIKTEIEGIKVAHYGSKIAYYFNAIPYQPGLLRQGQIVNCVVR